LNKKKLSVFLLVILLLSLNIVQAYADSLSELKQKQKTINAQIAENKKKITAMQKETKNVTSEINQLDYKVELASQDLEAVENELKIVNENIIITTEELKEAQTALNDKDEQFKKRLRTMYMNGDVGYIDVLLSSGDVKDFLSRQEMIQKIAEYDKELLVFMKDKRDTVDGKKTQLESQRASVEVTKSKIESRKQNYENVSREKEALMGRLLEDVKEFEKEYDKLNDFAKQIESQIYKLQVNTGAYSGGKMAWPLPSSTRITSQYGYRIHPIFKTKKLHTGLDVGAPSGSAIVAAADGTVIYSDWLGGYGKAIMVDHGGGIVTLYGHCSSLVKSSGTKVKRGDTIAKVGSTGNSTGPHLHFEVRKNGKYENPLPWVKGN